MSVLIKGIEMPTNCSECGQFRWNNFLQSDVCRIAEAIGDDGIFQSENEGIDNRPSWCPLVSILDVPQWIPVTERLPELNKEVLVYAVGKIDGFIGSSVYALTERFLFKFFPSGKGTEEWRSPWQYFMGDYEITHWMPLPEPPKEE